MHFQGQITKAPVIIAIQGTNKLHGTAKNSKITSETIKNDNLIISKDKIQFYNGGYEQIKLPNIKNADGSHSPNK